MAKITLKFLISSVIVGFVVGGVIFFALGFFGGILWDDVDWNRSEGQMYCYSTVLIVTIILVALRLSAKEDAPKAPPAPAQQNRCPTCGQPLEYVQQYSRWFCRKCNKYL